MTTIIRTPKGTTNASISGTTLTLNSITVNKDSSLAVGLAFDKSQGKPSSVKWGTLNLIQKGYNAHSSSAFAIALYVLPRANRTKTLDLVATWSVNITHRTMFATMMTNVNMKDQAVLREESTNTTEPSSGLTGTLHVAEEMAFAVFGCNGPITDSPGIPQYGFSSGQRDGTTNLTIEELYKSTSSTDAIEAKISGAVSHKWLVGMITLEPITEIRQGITQSDMLAMRELFENNNPALDENTHAFHYNVETDKWELYTIDLSSGTLVSTRTIDWT